MEPPAPEQASKPPPRVTADRNSKLSALLASIDADLDLELTAKAAAPAADDSGVNAFRRAKFFFPKVLEEQRKAKEAREAAAATKQKAKGSETQPPTVRSSSSPDRPRGTDHVPKRRKVSHAGADGKAKAPHDSRSPAGSPLANSPSRHDRRTGARNARSISLSSGSPSPPPPSRLDKGKGRATSHSVNADVVYATNTNTSSPPPTRQQTSTGGADKDASVVLIESTDDSDSDDDVQPYRPPDRMAPVVSRRDRDEGDVVDEVTDPEFREYIERARDKAAKARQDAELDAVFGDELSQGPKAGATFSSNTTASTKATSASQATTASMGPSGSNLSNASLTPSGDTGTAPAIAKTTPPAAQPQTTTVTSSQPASSDQQYRVFITSHLPNEVPPLLATMRMDQEMRYARNAYLHHAAKHNVHLSDEAAQRTLLTWKGSKIYNFTTGASLGVQPDAKGRFRDYDSMAMVAADAGAGKPAAGFQSGGLHLEIWTEDLYAAYLQAEERRRRRNLGELVEGDLSSDGDDDVEDGGRGASRGPGGGPSGAPGQGPESASANSTRIRLVLASRAHEKLKITAHGDTTIETLATAFRLQRGIEPDKTVAIMWDGDELEGSMTVGEAEMEDMDSVEVYIR
ncbi:hypothetical protein SPBR_04156 [Sporothrix brasiliensis 5110]|uniref:Ubiquitin-like domain-containing protein n=1 Tax=Sporothrix brasiliensis 5110 TaxID=1398154 RepID=A0A0C2IX48_9PEZI|nr:uncharacterized protein SPBR_04156 [Sporothrix brasiliensis 5110]KIH93676.1 hypothetical protein SPBR_04156 [Sporothrix brasiliensis 5110]